MFAQANMHELRTAFYWFECGFCLVASAPAHFVCGYIGFLWAVNFCFIISSVFSVRTSIFCVFFWPYTLRCRQIKGTKIEGEREKVIED